MNKLFKPLLVRLYTFMVATLYKYSFRLGITLVRFSRGGKEHHLSPLRGNSGVSGPVSRDTKFKIVIITFSKRFFSHCLPLVKELRESGVSQEIIVGINGDFGTTFDRELRQNFLKQLTQYEGVSPVCFSTFRGLSTLWNRAIICADSEITVVLNDDLVVNRETATRTLEMLVESTSTSGICLLNLSWSHFAISDKVFRNIGYFDERLLGVGEEDTDMTYRFEAYYGFTPPTISADGLIHDSSFEFDSKIKTGKGKYSLFNWAFIEKKYSFGEGMKSRMFDLPGNLALNELPLYPAEEWRHLLQDYLTSDERNEIDSKIQEIISDGN